MSDSRLFLVAGAGVLAGGLIAGLLLGPVATNSPLLALAIIAATAGGGAVLVNKVI